MKQFTKVTEEVTYSWEMYLRIIDMVVAKIIRDLTVNLKKRTESSAEKPKKKMSAAQSQKHSRRGEMSMSVDSHGNVKKSPKKSNKEFTIDEEFFHSVIMPSIY